MNDFMFGLLFGIIIMSLFAIILWVKKEFEITKFDLENDINRLYESMNDLRKEMLTIRTETKEE